MIALMKKVMEQQGQSSAVIFVHSCSILRDNFNPCVLLHFPNYFGMSLAPVFGLQGSFAGRKRQLMDRDGTTHEMMRSPSTDRWAMGYMTKENR
jgi:hypothetical protein